MELPTVRTISHYSSDMDILLVGEGDFSFATAMARAFQTAPRLLATSLDSPEMLHASYGWFIIEGRLTELLLRGVRVMNGVDVKTIVQHPTLCNLSFDRIIYNFPHSGFVSGLNERNKELIRNHRQLMRSFFKNVRSMLKVGGEVHVTHHTCEPYSRWRLKKEAAKSGLILRACYKFEAQVFVGYKPRRGAGANANGTFYLHNPLTFISFLPYSPSPPSIIPCYPLSPPPSFMIPPPRPSPHSSTPTSFHCPRPLTPSTIPPKPCITIFTPPPPPSQSSINIPSHHDHHPSVKSPRTPYNLSPPTFKKSFQSECNQHSSLDDDIVNKDFSWVSTLIQVIKSFLQGT